MEWISVEDRLPEIGLHVLVWNGSMHEDYLATNDHEFQGKRSVKDRVPVWVIQCERVGGTITRWMPLLASPTK